MTLPPDRVRMGSGLINIMQQGIGGTTGIAVMTTFLEHRISYHANLLDQQQVLLSLPWLEIIKPVGEFLAEAGEAGSTLGIKSLALLQRQLMLEATMTAYQDCFLLMTALCIIVMPLVLLIRRVPNRAL